MYNVQCTIFNFFSRVVYMYTAVFSNILAKANFKNPQSINRTKYKFVTVIFHTFFCQIITTYQYVKCLVKEIKFEKFVLHIEK